MHIYTNADGPPCQLSIDALNTATPNLAGLTDIAQCTYMHGIWTPLNWPQLHTRPLHQINFTYRRMHIYTNGRWTPSQLSIDALNTTTPKLFLCWSETLDNQRWLTPYTLCYIAGSSCTLLCGMFPQSVGEVWIVYFFYHRAYRPYTTGYFSIFWNIFLVYKWIAYRY